MIKNKIKLLQLFCFLWAGDFADQVNRAIAHVSSMGENSPIEGFRHYKEQLQAHFNAIKANMTWGEYLLYIQQTAEMPDFEEKTKELKQYLLTTKINEYRNRVNFTITNILLALKTEHKKMQAFVRTGPEVNCAIIGLTSKRKGAIEDFLRECTDERMIHFVSQALPQDRWIMQNDAFIKAVRDNPELKARFEQINAVIQEKVESADKKELWRSCCETILN